MGLEKGDIEIRRSDRDIFLPETAFVRIEWWFSYTAYVAQELFSKA
jgi:hypothetical protein